MIASTSSNVAHRYGMTWKVGHDMRNTLVNLRAIHFHLLCRCQQYEIFKNNFTQSPLIGTTFACDPNMAQQPPP
ncbi:hypothetical protein GH714_010611 [Hevea brasiliensis]|uniref:Uncharacterized protein n=1 Tax=Hevea brasiliensis TaxID=3981 RepID=A0A6A6MX56_HEVBR|nr:hypothetical protein GH714_010611 [Hevea brasiliensis]